MNESPNKTGPLKYEKQTTYICSDQYFRCVKAIYNVEAFWGSLYISKGNLFFITIRIYIDRGEQKKGPIQILHRNSALYYAIALNFGRNTTSIALNSNWYNLASMLQFNVFCKPFHILCLLIDVSSFLSQFISSFKTDRW